MKKLGLFLICAFAFSNIGTAQDATMHEVDNYKACNLVAEQTLFWTAAKKDVVVTTEVQNSDGEMPKTILTIANKDGSVIFSQKGSDFAESGPLYTETIDCEYHQYMASEITLAGLRGEGASIYGVEVKEFSDIKLMLDGAKFCEIHNVKYWEHKDERYKSDGLKPKGA